MPIAAVIKEKCVPCRPATYPQKALPAVHVPMYTSMNTAIARARTQSGAKFWMTVVIKEMIAVHAIPPNKMATDRSATDLNAATPQSDPAKAVVPSASSASDENNERVRCSARAPSTAPAPKTVRSSP